MIAASTWFVRIAFEHGAFTSRDTEVAAYVQSILVQIPFYTVILFVRMLTSMQRNRAALGHGDQRAAQLRPELPLHVVDGRRRNRALDFRDVVVVRLSRADAASGDCLRAPLATGAELDPAPRCPTGRVRRCGSASSSTSWRRRSRTGRRQPDRRVVPHRPRGRGVTLASTVEDYTLDAAIERRALDLAGDSSGAAGAIVGNVRRVRALSALRDPRRTSLSVSSTR